MQTGDLKPRGIHRASTGWTGSAQHLHPFPATAVPGGGGENQWGALREDQSHVWFLAFKH